MIVSKVMFRMLLLLLLLCMSLAWTTSCTSPPCANVCQDGQSACTAGGQSLIFCAKDANTGCWTWATLACYGENNQCISTAGKSTCSKGSHTGPCQDACKVGDQRCVEGGVETCEEKAGGGCPTWGSKRACATDETCTNGQCNKKPTTCQNTCQEGSIRCAGNAIETCRKDTKGCLQWSAGQACPTGQTCQNGICSSSCQSKCKSGDKRCVAKGLQTCTQISPECWDWGTAKACPSDQTCQTNQCTCKQECKLGDKRCVTKGLSSCTQSANSCKIWGAPKACPAGQTCQTNQCASTCKHACSQGQTKCDGGTQQQTCTQDSQGCRKWGTSQACPSGQTCQGDRCKASGCTDACKANTKRCYGNSVQTCQVGSNSCTLWGTAQSCPKGQVCDEGKCGVVNLNQRTQQQVCTRWKRDYPATSPLGFKNNGQKCDPGAISRGAINETMRRLSLYRWLVGLSPTVEDPALSEISQSCAILQANNDGPSPGVNSHKPPSSWNCYTQKGAQGSGASNLSWGVSNPADTISQYMSDARTPSLGHRLWCISPGLAKAGIGMATGSGRYRVASCLYVFSRSSGPTVDFVAYPPPGYVPLQAMGVGSRHSILDWSFNSTKYKVSSLTSVTLIRKSDGEKQTIKPRRIGGFGQPSGLSFRPRFPKAGETYTVKLGNVFSYTVKFFDCK